MNVFSQLLFLLIEINQETILSCLGLEDQRMMEIRKLIESNVEIDLSKIGPSPEVSVETFRIILNEVWHNLQQGGLGLSDIENIIFLMAFVRFIILVSRFNLKTGFLITCIGLVAAYFWYLHLSQVLFAYMRLLFQMPYMTKASIELLHLREAKKAVRVENFTIRYPLRLIWRGFVNGAQKNEHNIDPISMLFANFTEQLRPYTDSFYYVIYRDIGPTVIKMCRRIYNDIGPLARYTYVVRLGKKYCPYLIRWHWTFTMLMQVSERFLIYFVYRLSLYTSRVLVPNYRITNIEIPTSQFRGLDLGMQINLLNFMAYTLVSGHIAFVIYALLQALWGQYFYVPFYTENVELHLGGQPKSSYTGGNVPWQYSKDIRYKYGGLVQNISHTLRRLIKRLFKKFLRK